MYNTTPVFRKNVNKPVCASAIVKIFNVTAADIVISTRPAVLHRARRVRTRVYLSSTRYTTFHANDSGAIVVDDDLWR